MTRDTIRPRLIRGAAAALAFALSLAPAAARAQGPADDFERGKQLLARGDVQGAAEALKRASEQRKTDAHVWYEYGLALTRAQKQKEARKAFERAVALRDSAPARTGLAFTQFLLGKTRDAEREAGRALALDPGHAQAHYVMAAVHFRNERMEETVQEAEQALRLDPDFAAAARLGGEALLNLFNGEFERAAERYPVEKSASGEVIFATIEKREVLVASAKGRLRVAAERLRRLADSPAAGTEKENLSELAATLEFYGTPQNRTEPPPAYKQSEVSTRAVILAKPEPGFTTNARGNDTGGVVRLRAVLAADGRVRHISVVKGQPDGLTERAIEAARQIRFTPATLDGRRVSQYVVLEYHFVIGGLP